MAVVGAGYCGLAAGRDLARAGRSVVVVDREPVGVGATHPQRRHGDPRAQGRPGRAASGSTARSAGACTTRSTRPSTTSRRSSPTRRIDCDYAPHRTALPGPHAPARAGLEAHGRTSTPRSSASRCTSCPATTLADEIGSTAFLGGVVLERTGGLHPARFHAGLARLALGAGADVHDRTPASPPRAAGRGRPTGFDVRHRHGGTSIAGDVIVATNAYADGAGARAAPPGRCRSARYIIATEVLDPERGPVGQPHTVACSSTPRTSSSTGASPPTAGCSSAVAAASTPPTSRRPATSSTTPWCGCTRSWGRADRVRVGRQRRHHAGPHAPRRPASTAGPGTPPAATARASRSTPGSAHRLAAVLADGEPPPGFADLRFPAGARCTRSARPTSRSSASGSASRTDAPDPPPRWCRARPGAMRARLAG